MPRGLPSLLVVAPVLAACDSGTVPAASTVPTRPPPTDAARTEPALPMPPVAHARASSRCIAELRYDDSARWVVRELSPRGKPAGFHELAIDDMPLGSGASRVAVTETRLAARPAGLRRIEPRSDSRVDLQFKLASDGTYEVALADADTDRVVWQERAALPALPAVADDGTLVDVGADPTRISDRCAQGLMSWRIWEARYLFIELAHSVSDLCDRRAEAVCSVFVAPLPKDLPP